VIDIPKEGLAALKGTTVLGSLRDSDLDANEGYERIFIALTGGWVLSICVQARPPLRQNTEKFVDGISETVVADVPSDGWTKDYERSVVGTDTLKYKLHELLADNYRRASVVALYNMSDKDAQEEYLRGFGLKVKLWYESLQPHRMEPVS
jgi:hypothetical protein